jgi:hypothetical protein
MKDVAMEYDGEFPFACAMARVASTLPQVREARRVLTEIDALRERLAGERVWLSWLVGVCVDEDWPTVRTAIENRLNGTSPSPQPPTGHDCARCGASVAECDQHIRDHGSGCCTSCYLRDTHGLLRGQPTEETTP